MVTSRWALAWLVVLVLLMVSGCTPIWHDHVMNHGVAARAVVTSLDQTGAFLNEQPECDVGLRVEPKDGSPFRATVRTYVLLTQLAELRPGAVVTVRFDPDDPAKMVIAGLGHALFDEAEASRMLEANQAMLEELNEPGAATQADAIVIAFERTGVSINGDNTMAFVRLKVLPANGPRFDATVLGVFAPSGLPKYQPGREVHVVYDPANPQRVTFDVRRMATTVSGPSGASP
jgi:hypothetical protein